MLSGPRVDIYVGKENKHYLLPKLLLCHYSPFFDKCFNGLFKEGQTQKLELPDDKVEFFELLVEYMLHEKVQDSTMFSKDRTFEDDKDHCIEFIAYAEKYGVGEACIVVKDALHQAVDIASEKLSPRPQFHGRVDLRTTTESKN
jgi:hypothetical protein